MAVEGNKPEWNETLCFPLRSKTGKGFSVEELVNSNIMIYVSIFDEVKNIDRDDFTGMFTFSIEKRFLGSFTIPLSTVL